MFLFCVALVGTQLIPSDSELLRGRRKKLEKHPLEEST